MQENMRNYFIRALEGRAGTYILTGNFENAIADYNRLAREKGKAKIRGIVGKAEIYGKTGNFKQAVRLLERAERICRENGWEENIAEIRARKGFMKIRLGKPEEAIRDCELAIKIAEKYKLTETLNRGLVNLASIYTSTGNVEKSLFYLEKALKNVQRKGNKKGEATILHNMGVNYLDAYRYRDAEEMLKKSMEIRKKIGDVWGLASCYYNLGNLYRYQGNYSRAMFYYLKSKKIREEINDPHGIARCEICIGVLSGIKGDYSGAANAFLHALQIFRKSAEPRGITTCLINLAYVEYFNGNYREAEKYFLESLRISREKRMVGDILTSLFSLLRIYLEQGRKETGDILNELEKMKDEPTFPEWDMAKYRLLSASDSDRISCIKVLKKLLEKEETEIKKGEFLLFKGMVEKDGESLLGALSISRKLGEKELEQESLYRLSLFYLENGDIKNAERYILRLKKHAEITKRLLPYLHYLLFFLSCLKRKPSPTHYCEAKVLAEKMGLSPLLQKLDSLHPPFECYKNSAPGRKP